MSNRKFSSIAMVQFSIQTSAYKSNTDYKNCRQEFLVLLWRNKSIIISRQKSAAYIWAYVELKGVPSVKSSRSVRGLGKGVSGKPYPRLCNARRPRLEQYKLSGIL